MRKEIIVAVALVVCLASASFGQTTRQVETRKELANRPVMSTVDSSGTAVNSPIVNGSKTLLVPRTSNMVTFKIRAGENGSARIRTAAATGGNYDSGEMVISGGDSLDLPVAGFATTDSSGAAPSFLKIDATGTTVSFSFRSFYAVPPLN